jgi:hypothetical protein
MSLAGNGPTNLSLVYPLLNQRCRVVALVVGPCPTNPYPNG